MAHYSIILILAKFKLKTLSVSVAEQAGLSLTWSQTPEDRFSRDVAQIIAYQQIMTNIINVTRWSQRLSTQAWKQYCVQLIRLTRMTVKRQELLL